MAKFSETGHTPWGEEGVKSACPLSFLESGPFFILKWYSSYLGGRGCCNDLLFCIK